MDKKVNLIADWGLATELFSTLEEIADKRSQYGRPSVDEPAMLKRCRYLAEQLEKSLKAQAGEGAA